MRAHLRIIAVVGLTSATAFGVTMPLTTTAGSGVPGFAGDGGPAHLAQLGHPTGVAALPDGGYLIADQDNNRVRRVTAAGTITTVAGDGDAGAGGDGGPATTADLFAPAAVAVTADGGFVIADQLNNRIRSVDAAGTITTIAGDGAFGFAGDGGPAAAAQLDRPAGVGVTHDGSILVADTFNNRIRRVSPDGLITTVAGDGEFGDAGDGGPATSASLNLPTGVVAVPGGGFLIADQGNHRVRRVDPDGTIHTVAGSGEPGFAGDDGPARQALLDSPSGVATTPDGGYVIADQDNQRIRQVSATGIITTIAGDGADPAEEAAVEVVPQLAFPSGVAVTEAGGLLIADTANNRVQTFATTPGPGASARQLPLAIRAKRAIGARRTIRVTYEVNLDSRVSLWVKAGVRRPVRVASKTASAGPGAIVWNGRLHGRWARPGRYTLIVTATAGTATSSSRLTARLTAQGQATTAARPPLRAAHHRGVR